MIFSCFPPSFFYVTHIRVRGEMFPWKRMDHHSNKTLKSVMCHSSLDSPAGINKFKTKPTLEKSLLGKRLSRMMHHHLHPFPFFRLIYLLLFRRRSISSIPLVPVYPSHCVLNLFSCEICLVDENRLSIDQRGCVESTHQTILLLRSTNSL